MSVRKILLAGLIIIAVFSVIAGLAWLCHGYFSFMDSGDERGEGVVSDGRQVLFISSYSMASEKVRNQVNGIRSVLRGRGIPFDCEFMDTGNFNTAENRDMFYRSLSYKLSHHRPYDALIVADDSALLFALRHREEFFSGIPVIFLGINDFELARQAEADPLVTGSMEYLYLPELVRIILRLKPGVRTIIGMYDDSVSAGVGIQKQFFALRELFPGQRFFGIDTNNYTKEALAVALRSLPSDGVLINCGFSEDMDGIVYSVDEQARVISGNAAIPCFSAVPDSVGRGYVGGVSFNFFEAGRLAAQTLLSIFDGAAVSGRLPDSHAGFRYVFDYSVMRKWGFDESLLPAGTVLMNKGRSYFDRYSFIFMPFIVIMLALLVLLGVILAYAVAVRSARRQLEFDAEHNALTGLPNRMVALRDIGRMVAHRRRFSILYIDIVSLKTINDYYSRETGDAILREFARRLVSLRSDEDYSAYCCTSDEFVLLLRDRHLEPHCMELHHIGRMLSEPYCAGMAPVAVRTSVGVANSGEGNADAELYLSNAELAMYESKLLGNRHVLFSVDMRETAMRRQEMVRIVEAACQKDEFYVVFQPQVRAEDCQICGYEALTRLRIVSNGEPRNISPAEFIPVAESSGYIAMVGRIITEKAIRHMSAWRAHGIELRKVSINYSVGQMVDGGYVDFLRGLMEQYSIPPDLICIEITESLFADDKEQAMSLFRRFREIGVTLALDDFGSGYSSLSYLASLPVDTVKLDKSIIDTYLAHSGKDAFVRNIVNMVHSLGMKLTVEGVEERWQFDKLRIFGGDTIQGYFFSRPISADDVEKFRPVLGE